MFTTRSPCHPAPVTDAASAVDDDADADVGVLLVAHGSRRGDLAAERMARRHAKALVTGGTVGEAAAATLFGGTNPADALRRMRSRCVRVVPMFMSDGYYVRDMIPKALSGNGALKSEGKRNVRHCPPIGLEPALADLIVDRANAAFAKGDVCAADGTLLLIGHGSSKDPASRRATELQAERVAAAACFRAVRTCFLEEQPELGRTLAALTGPVVAEALFASHGLHAGRDIVDAIGRLGNPDIIYLGAIGEDARMVDVIADCAAVGHADARYRVRR